MLDLLGFDQVCGTRLPSFDPTALDLLSLQRYGGPERRSAGSLAYRRMAQMLDAIDYGMLLLIEVAEVAHINQVARRELDVRHPLHLNGRELRARHVHDMPPLHAALQDAASKGLRRLLRLGDAIARTTVAVVPLPPLGKDQRHGVLLLLGKSQVCEELTVDWFARSQRLTPAETQVLKRLCADMSPQEVAEDLGVGLATVRSQIGSIRAKTGADSIRGLVRQVSVLPPLMSALQAVPSTRRATALN